MKSTKWELILVIVIIIGLFFVALANAEDNCLFQVILQNDTDHKAIYMLDWKDHPFEAPYDFNLMGGELSPKSSLKSFTHFLCGSYVVSWRYGGGKEYIHIFDQKPWDDDPRILILPDRP